MKAIRKISIWKVISFITLNLVVLISCMSCEPEDNNPKISLLSTENITANSATLVASLTTKDKPLLVFFKYSRNGVDTFAMTTVYQANQTVIVKKEITGLTQGKVYQIKAEACFVHDIGQNIGYATVASTNGTFITLDPSILIIREMKSDFTSISVKLELTPKVANTKVQLNYTVNGSIQTKLSEAYSGNSAVEINFKLDNLVKNTDYQIKIKTINEFAVSADTIFKTCAVSDFDGNTYRIVTIGNQVWLQENFRGTHFANGDPIPNITGQTEWDAATSPAYCYYNNDIKNAVTYGALYNWYVAKDSRGLIFGFHTPSYEEWRVITDYLGGDMNAGGAMKEAGFAHWTQPNVGATNSSGFTGLPAGARQEKFNSLGDGVVFWSSSIFFGMTSVACTVSLGENSAILRHAGDDGVRGLSIRLVKN